jgi:hypothetical protein
VCLLRSCSGGLGRSVPEALEAARLFEAASPDSSGCRLAPLASRGAPATLTIAEDSWLLPLPRRCRGAWPRGSSRSLIATPMNRSPFSANAIGAGAPSGSSLRGRTRRSADEDGAVERDCESSVVNGLAHISYRLSRPARSASSRPSSFKRANTNDVDRPPMVVLISVSARACARGWAPRAPRSR